MHGHMGLLEPIQLSLGKRGPAQKTGAAAVEAEAGEAVTTAESGDGDHVMTAEAGSGAGASAESR